MGMRFGSIPGAGLVTLEPTGDPTGIEDAANIMAAWKSLPVSGGIIRLVSSGQWNIAGGQVIINQSNVYIDAPGCYIKGVGSGDVFRMYDSTVSPTNRIYLGGGITGRPVIDGSAMGSGSWGIHAGDIGGLKVDAYINNFTALNSGGISLENAFFWTEGADVLVKTKNCQRGAQFNVSGAGTKSFGYGNFDIKCSPPSNQQDGVAILGGSWIYHGRLRIRGDFTSGASATSAAVLRIQGTGPGGASRIVGTHLEVQVECGPGGANAATTIIMDTSPFCEIFGCYGQLDFQYGGTTFTPSSLNVGQFIFNGMVNGDSGLAPADSNYGMWAGINTPVFYKGLPSTAGGSANGSVPTMAADFTTMTLTASVTIVLAPAAFLTSTIAGPQRVTIIIKQNATGGFTVTWPHNLSPTNASPTVNWAGGAAPVMTAAANATDVYDLVTYDGATWYGRATQNVS